MLPVPVPCPAAPQHHLCTSHTEPCPIQDLCKGRVERVPHLLSAEIAHPERAPPAAAPFPPSHRAPAEKEEGSPGRCLSSHGDSLDGGRYKGQLSRYCNQHRATGPPWRWPWPPMSPSGLLQLLLPYHSHFQMGKRLCVHT